jgi:hypothetical protein
MKCDRNLSKGRLYELHWFEEINGFAHRGFYNEERKVYR